jgi:N utilization substance protein A
MILDVREEPNQVRIVLTQTHPDYIRKLFELEVPEVAERIIDIRALAREAGYRTKIAVVGVRGSRIRNIVDELGGEKIDIVRWNESSQVLISNALKPAEVKEIFLCFELGRATVVVDEDQLSLAIGKRGQNVRLGARLTGWDIDILTPPEYDRQVDALENVLKAEGVEDVMLDKLLAIGVISLQDVADVGTEPLVNEVGMTQELAEKVVAVATEAAPRIAAEEAARKAADAEAKKAAAAAEAREQARAAAALGIGIAPSDVVSAPVHEVAELEEEAMARAERTDEAALIAEKSAGWEAEQEVLPEELGQSVEKPD